jgi:hypothetical protein
LVHSRVSREEIHVLVALWIPNPDTLCLGEDDRKGVIAETKENILTSVSRR